MSASSAAPGSVTATLFSPINELLPRCEKLRDCPELPDDAWIRLGLERALHELPSGRAFLQEHAYALAQCPPKANYFASLKSERRLSLAQELNQGICLRVSQTVSDPLAQYSDWADFDLYAGDGHWHGAAAHDLPLGGAKRAVGHFYALDLRHHTLRHLAVGVGKKEHEMHVLKRLDIEQLRQFASCWTQSHLCLGQGWNLN